MEKELLKLLNNAYAPYSKYKVAAIVEIKDGTTFKGVNVENASYGATICAERNAINNSIAHGYGPNDFKALHLMNSSKKIGFPCFLCRQTISEFFDIDTDIYLYTKEGLKKVIKTKDIIINPFTSENLK